MLLAGQEVEDDLAVGEVADHPPVGRGETAKDRHELGRPRPPLGGRQRGEVGDERGRTGPVAHARR